VGVVWGVGGSNGGCADVGVGAAGAGGVPCVACRFYNRRGTGRTGRHRQQTSQFILEMSAPTPHTSRLMGLATPSNQRFARVLFKGQNRSGMAHRPFSFIHSFMSRGSCCHAVMFENSFFFAN